MIRMLEQRADVREVMASARHEDRTTDAPGSPEAPKAKRQKRTTPMAERARRKAWRARHSKGWHECFQQAVIWDQSIPMYD